MSDSIYRIKPTKNTWLGKKECFDGTYRYSLCRNSENSLLFLDFSKAEETVNDFKTRNLVYKNPQIIKVSEV